MFIKFIQKSTIFLLLTCCINLTAFSQNSSSIVCQTAVQTSFIEEIESHPIILSNHLPVATGHYNPINGSIYELLDKAQSSILIFTFTFNDPKTGKVLNEKAAQGLKIKIVLDRAHIGNLKTSLHFSIEIITRELREGHVHHKMLIVDEAFVWNGSPNFSAEGILSAKNASIAYYDPVAAAALHHEALCIERKAKRNQAAPISTVIGNQLLELYLLPHTEPNTLSYYRMGSKLSSTK